MNYRSLAPALLAFWLFACWPGAALGQEPAGDPAVRLAIINLFETDLSGAYSFQGEGKLPDFSTLDKIYPPWDDNDPGAARRKWVEGHYLYYKVVYRADSVFITSEVTARVRGKKTTSWERKVPFMWWFERSKSDEISTIFEGWVYRDPRGGWVVRSIREM